MQPSASSAATVAVLIVAAAFVVFLGPRPRPATPPGGGPVPREQRAERHVAGRQATHRPRAAAPHEVVARYYRALDERRFEAAWRILSPAVREAFGDFDAWRAGYATTVSSRPLEVAVSEGDGAAVVTLVLAAADRSPCGPVLQRFAVRWELRRAGGSWQAASLTAVKRSGRAPDAVCPASHDAGGVVRAS